METDVVVVGSGAAGLTTAVVAANLGLQVLMLESTPWFGGTTATSGGAAWIPLNRRMQQMGVTDSCAEAETYLRNVLGDLFEPAKVSAFLHNAAPMIEFLEGRTDVRMIASNMPDYEPGRGGWKIGRTLLTPDFDARLLGDQKARLRPPRRDTTLFHSMQLSLLDPVMLKRAHKSWPALQYALKLLAAYLRDRVLHGRGMRVTNGNALAGRLLLSAIRAGVTLWADAPAKELIISNGAVTGVIATKDGVEHEIQARRGVMLASGGFGANAEMRAKYIPHAAYGLNLQTEGNRGDGIKMGIAAGGRLNECNVANGIWQIVSQFPRSDGSWAVAIYMPDRLSPGSLIVDPTGKRFVNEATNYHEFVRAMHAKGLKKAWMISEAPAARKYGIGLAKPWPFRIRPWIAKGYVIAAPTLTNLAAKIGVDANTLNATVAGFNRNAELGTDPEFHRGEDEYSRYNGDREHKPNPSLGPVRTTPFYAIELRPAETSTLAGLETNADAQVLGPDNAPIKGLYAAGLDNNTIARGFYPGAGCSIGPAMTFGYIAARQMAASVANAGERQPALLYPEPELTAR